MLFIKASTSVLYYIVDWLPPDFGAVGQYALNFARDYARGGQRICLIGLSSGSSETTYERFDNGGVLEIRRVRSEPVQKSSNLRRLLWAVSANVRLLRAFLALKPESGAVLQFTGSPPFMLWFAVMARALCQLTLRYRITDFYPEVVLADKAGRSLALEMLRRVTWWLRRRVDAFEALGEDQRRLLIEGGVAPHRIKLQRDSSPVRITGQEARREPPGALKGHLVLLYSGNFGVAHDADTVVKGLRLHHDAGGRCGLWLNATGAKANDIEQALKAMSMPCARTLPGPLEELPSTLLAADVHLISLRNEFAGYVLPSKVYACIETRKPILYVGPKGSDVHLLCSSLGAERYQHVECGDAAGFAKALDALTCHSSTSCS